LSTFNGNVTVRIDGIASGLFFSVVGLETFALEISHDPDLPPGQRTRSWATVESVDGPGPIAVRKGQALVVTVGFGVPDGSAPETFDASAVIVGNGVDLASLPIVAVDQGPTTIGITVGHLQSDGSIAFGPGEVQFSNITPEPRSLQFVAVSNLSDGATGLLNPTFVTWKSSDPGTASLAAASGLATAESHHTRAFTISAFCQTFSAEATLRVE
jgi:hypothetical protein